MEEGPTDEPDLDSSRGLEAEASNMDDETLFPGLNSSPDEESKADTARSNFQDLDTDSTTKPPKKAVKPIDKNPNYISGPSGTTGWLSDDTGAKIYPQ